MIIAIEGGVGAGKTTLIKKLGIRSNVITVPEYFDIIPSEEHEAILQLSKREQLDIFLDIEKRRLSSLNSKLCKDALYLVDRSFLSLFSFQYSIGKLPTLSPRLFTQSHMTKNFIMPDAIIHLDVDYETRKKRVKERGHDVSPVLLDANFVSKTREFLEAVGPSVPYVRIDTTHLTSEQVERKALTFLIGLEQTTDLQLSKFVETIAPFRRTVKTDWKPQLK